MGRKTATDYSVSYSEMAMFKECRRRWNWQYLQGYRSPSKAVVVARDTGILVHGALEQYYRLLAGDDAETTSLEWLEATIKESHEIALAAMAADEEMKKLTTVHDTARIVTEGYYAWLRETGADADIEFTGSEVEVIVPSGEPGVSIKGVIDTLGVDRRNGDIIVFDHKVVASFETMISSLLIGEQPLQYAMMVRIHEGAAMEGKNVRCVWNMIKRNKQTARAKPPFYMRYDVYVTLPMVQQYWRQVTGQIKDMVHMEAILAAGGDEVMVAYPTPTSDCTWKCPYFQVCGQANDPASDYKWTLDTFFEQREVVSPGETGNLLYADGSPIEHSMEAVNS